MTENTPPPAADQPADQPAVPPAGSPTPPPPPYGQPPAGQQPPPPPAYQQQPPPAYQQGYQQPGFQQPGYPAAPAMLSPSDERTWGTAAHWSALVAMLVGLSFLGPLIVMLTQGNKSPWVRRQAVESLNFQISMTIYAIVSAILIIVLIGLVLLLVVFALAVIMPIIASIKTSNGEDYRYPLTIRLVS